MIVVGVDVHVRNSFLHVADEAGRLLKRGRVGNTLAEIAQFLAAVELKPPRRAIPRRMKMPSGGREGGAPPAEPRARLA
jgi:hypothetical protein